LSEECLSDTFAAVCEELLWLGLELLDQSIPNLLVHWSTSSEIRDVHHLFLDDDDNNTPSLETEQR
jgi:hypothetical protein